MENTALSWDAKRDILSQQIIRQRMNGHQNLTQVDIGSNMNEFTSMMKNSVYNREQTREVMIAGLTGFEWKNKKAIDHGKKLHGWVKESLKTRRVRKLVG